MAAVDSRATATTAGEEQREERELHARRQEDNDDDATHGQDGLHASLPRTSSVSHKQIQPPRYVRSIPIGLQRANTLTSVNTGSSTGTGSPVKQQQSTSGTHVKVPRSRRTSVPFPDEEKGRTLPPRSESALGLSGTSTKSSDVTSPVKMSFSRSYNGLPAPDRKLQSLLFDYGDTSQVSELPSDPKTWTPSQLSIYVGCRSTPLLLALPLTRAPCHPLPPSSPTCSGSLLAPLLQT